MKLLGRAEKKGKPAWTFNLSVKVPEGTKASELSDYLAFFFGSDERTIGGEPRDQAIDSMSDTDTVVIDLRRV